jgi:hypothetical protein
MPRCIFYSIELFRKCILIINKWVIFKYNAIPSTLAENAAKEVLAVLKKSITDKLYCEKELRKKCRKIISVCTQILDDIGLSIIKAREG